MTDLSAARSRFLSGLGDLAGGSGGESAPRYLPHIGRRAANVALCLPQRPRARGSGRPQLPAAGRPRQKPLQADLGPTTHRWRGLSSTARGRLRSFIPRSISPGPGPIRHAPHQPSRAGIVSQYLGDRPLRLVYRPPCTLLCRICGRARGVCGRAGDAGDLDAMRHGCAGRGAQGGGLGPLITGNRPRRSRFGVACQTCGRRLA